VERILGRLPQRDREFAKATDVGPSSPRLDRVRGIIERSKPYSFRHRAIEAFLTSDWTEVD